MSLYVNTTMTRQSLINHRFAKHLPRLLLSSSAAHDVGGFKGVTGASGRRITRGRATAAGDADDAPWAGEATEGEGEDEEEDEDEEAEEAGVGAGEGTGEDGVASLPEGPEGFAGGFDPFLPPLLLPLLLLPLLPLLLLVLLLLELLPLVVEALPRAPSDGPPFGVGGRDEPFGCCCCCCGCCDWCCCCLRLPPLPPPPLPLPPLLLLLLPELEDAELVLFSFSPPDLAFDDCFS